MILLYMSFIDDRKNDDRFERIYYSYKNKMMRIAESILHNYHDAEEAVQISFIAIAKNIEKLPVAESKAIEVYVCKCAKNAALNMLPSKLRRDRMVDIDEQYDLVDDNAIDDFISDDTYRLIVETIEALPDIYRDVLSLYYIYEMKPGAIASSLGKPVETVKSRIKRGKAIFFGMLKERIEHDK